MTFQVKIKTGPRVNDEWMNSFITLWIARENQPSELVINYGPWNLTAGSTAQDQKFGKIWLLPYHTGKSSAQSHATGYTWYDELIISRTQIADPAPSSSGSSSASSSGSGSASSSGSSGSGQTTNPSASAADTTAPSAPTNVTATGGSNQISLFWAASSDDVGVSSYRVQRNGTQVAMTNTTSYVDTGLAASAAYTYSISAVDAAGNASSQSAGATATTFAASSGSQPSSGSPTSLGQLADTLQPGQWVEVNTNGFSNGAFLETNTGPITQWSDKGVWDPTRRRFYFMGAPHGGVDKFIIYSADTNTWTTGQNPCQATGTACTVTHGYEHLTVNPATGELYYRVYYSPLVFKFEPSTGVWSRIANLPLAAPAIQCCGALEWFPDRNELIFVDGDWGVWAYTPGTNTWRKLSDTNAIRDAPDDPL